MGLDKRGTVMEPPASMAQVVQMLVLATDHIRGASERHIRVIARPTHTPFMYFVADSVRVGNVRSVHIGPGISGSTRIMRRLCGVTLCFYKGDQPMSESLHPLSATMQVVDLIVSYLDAGTKPPDPFAKGKELHQ